MGDLEQVTEAAGDVVFDTSSGISLEEQQEILAGINAMSGGNRLLPEAVVVGARKRGFLFPLIVNICALILLGAGFAFLFFLHGQDEQGIRENSAVLGLTERKLIQEIRQETSQKLNEKENEINSILSKLSAADSEYRVLQESVETLTEEQKERAASLLAMQENYRNTLSGLEEEKTKIIEDSILKETALRSQAEEKVLELSSRVEESQANLGAAMEELRKLGSEQERAAKVEGQMSGLYGIVNNQIESGSLDEASRTLATMKEFLNVPSFQDIRSLQARKQTHLAAIDALEEAVAKARPVVTETGGRSGGVVENQAGTAQDEALSALEARYAALDTKYGILEKKAADQEKALAVLSAQGSDQGKLMAEYMTEINTLRTANINQQETLNRRDSTIVSLNEENIAKDQQLTALNTNAASLRAQVQTAANNASESEAALAQQKKDYDALLAQKDELQRQYDDLQRRVDAALKAAMGE